MKVKDLLEKIEQSKKEHSDFLEWDIYTEQLEESDKINKTTGSQKDWEKTEDSDGWEYYKCHGFYTTMPNKKIFTINVNY